MAQNMLDEGKKLNGVKYCQLTSKLSNYVSTTIVTPAHLQNNNWDLWQNP